MNLNKKMIFEAVGAIVSLTAVGVVCSKVAARKAYDRGAKDTYESVIKHLTEEVKNTEEEESK